MRISISRPGVRNGQQILATSDLKKLQPAAIPLLVWVGGSILVGACFELLPLRVETTFVAPILLAWTVACFAWLTFEFEE